MSAKQIKNSALDASLDASLDAVHDEEFFELEPKDKIKEPMILSQMDEPNDESTEEGSEEGNEEGNEEPVEEANEEGNEEGNEEPVEKVPKEKPVPKVDASRKSLAYLNKKPVKKFITDSDDEEADQPMVSKPSKKEAAKKLLGFSISEDDEQPKNDDEDEVIEEEEPKPKSKKSSKPSKPKGKYDEMTLKELQTLTKERKVKNRSSLKTRDAIIHRLEELDANPPAEEEEAPKNKYSTMTIPELKKLMGERNIAGRSTIKTKPQMIEKLVAYDENPESVTAPPKEKSTKGIGKGGAVRHKKTTEEEDPQDEEVNKKVAELVNKIYKIKKHAKKQSPEFKTGFMDYINDLSTLIEDYQQSNQ